MTLYRGSLPEFGADGEGKTPLGEELLQRP